MSSYTLFHFLSLSLSLSLTSHLSSLHLPHSFLFASSSPSPLHFPWVFPSCLFISHGFFPLASSSPMNLSLTSSSPQLIAPSISYLISPLPTTSTIGDVALDFFFFLPPVLMWWFMYERCNFFSLLLFDSIFGFCGICYY